MVRVNLQEKIGDIFIRWARKLILLSLRREEKHAELKTTAEERWTSTECRMISVDKPATFAESGDGEVRGDISSATEKSIPRLDMQLDMLDAWQ